MTLRFLFLPAILALVAAPAVAQDIGRVAPASLPLPLPTAAPLPPDQLRARNPWNLPMTGVWRFKLTHGQINQAKQFVPSSGETDGITASSHESSKPTGKCV